MNTFFPKLTNFARRYTKESNEEAINVTKRITDSLKILLQVEDAAQKPADVKTLKDHRKTRHLFDKIYWEEKSNMDIKENLIAPSVMDMLQEVVKNRAPPPEDPFKRDLMDVHFRNHFLRIAAGVKTGRRGRVPAVVWTPQVTEVFRNEPQGFSSYEDTGDWESGMKLLEFQREQDGTDYMVQYHQNAPPLTKSQAERRRIRTTKRRVYQRRLENTLMVLQYTRKNKTKLDYLH
jgi:hypothetical protein